MRYRHNKNTTFYWSGDVVSQSTGVAANLSEYGIVSQVRDKHDNIIASLPVYKNDPQQGFIRIQADSSAWPCGDYIWDVKLSKDGITVATEQIDLTVYQGASHA